MAEVFFYHLTRSPVQATLATLLDKSLAAGWSVQVRVGDPARLDWFDDQLWLVPEDGFLPHAIAGKAGDCDEPVLLTGPGQSAVGRQALACVDGADLSPAEMAQLTRGMILFDGRDDAAVAHARTQWRALTGAGVKAKYWSEETGAWQMKAES